jgi:hypothetical protein
MRRSWTYLAIALVTAIPVAAYAATEMPLRVTKGPDEFEPAVSADFLAWEQAGNANTQRRVLFAQPTNGTPFRVNPKGSYAAGAGLDGARLVYATFKAVEDESDGHLGGDLRMVDLSSGSELPVPPGVNTRKEEYTPTISGDWLLFGRQSSGQRPRETVILQNVSTGEVRTLASSNKLYIDPGQLNGLFATWYACGRRAGSVCNVFRYDIAGGVISTIPNPGPAFQYAPSVAADGTVYFSRSGNGCGVNASLQKWAPAVATTTVVDFPDRVDGGDSYVFEDPAAGRRVVYHRASCLKDEFKAAPSDLYQVID